ncbi:ATP-binding cassette domain-containing protein [Falsibacillus pallidus]|uniref:ATP-binding cassette domain-containing protein n=1 Tax=Falsibacillus pallidus TaxID=493781 RepID=UPI003D98AF72
MNIKNLSFSYQNRSVLKNVNIEFKKNKTNVLLGLNGAGKTTLFDLMTGVIPMSENSCFKNFPSYDEVLYQLQGIPFLTTLKGKDLVKVFLNSDYKNRNSKKPLKAQFDLTDGREKGLLDRLWELEFGKMSVGERRWLIITTICHLDRKLYIFDEPTAGIDPDAKIKILKRIEDLSNKKDSFVILSSHQLHELKYIDCHLFFLHQGEIIFNGSYNEFISFTNTENPDQAFYEMIESVG